MRTQNKAREELHAIRLGSHFFFTDFSPYPRRISLIAFHFHFTNSIQRSGKWIKYHIVRRCCANSFELLKSKRVSLENLRPLRTKFPGKPASTTAFIQHLAASARMDVHTRLTSRRNK